MSMETDSIPLRQIELIENQWRIDPRWRGVTRPYAAQQVLRLRGTLRIEHTVADRMSRKLWRLLEREPNTKRLWAQATLMRSPGFVAKLPPRRLKAQPKKASSPETARLRGRSCVPGRRVEALSAKWHGEWAARPPAANHRRWPSNKPRHFNLP